MRTNFYIDGFNLYYGMMDAGYNHCKWLDIHLLANTIKHSSHVVANVKYFTSRINNNIQKQKRQNSYIDALMAQKVDVIFGEFRTNWIDCKSCKGGWYDSKEKKTDVNIAVHLMKDAFKDNFDVAIIVSGDSDLVPPVLAVRELFPNKEVRVAFPPTHESNDLKKAANGSFVIGRKKLEDSLLPNKLKDKYGNDIVKPNEWL
jgi:uncharacterized LabA/DUF88 family protein